MDCKYCKNRCVKAGFQKSGTQKYYCNVCNKYQQQHYRSNAYLPNTNNRIERLVVEGVSLRGMERILGISLKTILKRIRKIARLIKRPFVALKKQVYEMDEMWTYIGRKSPEVWVMYALERSTKRVVDFHVGSRTKTN